MRKAIVNFAGILLGILTYSGLIQYSDTGSIDFTELIFDPVPWVIALITAVAISVFTNFLSSEPENT